MRKTIATLMCMGVLMAFFWTSCEKEPTPTQPTSNTYTFVYDEYGIPSDTALAHMDADTFYVIPKKTTLFASWPQKNVNDIRNHLDSRQRLNPKTRGKGTIVLANVTESDSIWLSNFGYNVER